MRVVVLLLVMLLSGCVSFPDAPQATHAPTIEDDQFIAVDGTPLTLDIWQADEPRAVLVALHGMNDYAHAFALPGAYWAETAGITTYALDQRGFGRSPQFGHWVGEETMAADLRGLVEAVRRNHPGLPVFAVGHSMGAAVLMSAQLQEPLNVDGLILAAPGVWGGRALPLPYRMSANFAAMLAPGKTLTGERADRQASDNIEILRAMYYDPHVVKETRLDAIVGAIRVMGTAYNGADDIRANILVLIGEKDEIIPLKAMEKTAMRLDGDVTVHRYPEGWHLLFRDLQGEKVWRDVARWIARQTNSKFALGG
ncbi:lysophospholipase [Hyphococcus formosus]|uniref:alpha/beta hydrolase n=1 Tax=Hyphococcus formosus TaxID=3143534 RepID=UPI00398B1342